MRKLVAVGRAGVVRLAPALVLALAAFLRIYGIQWDGGYLFHPDERQILLVVDGLTFPWPPNWSLLLSPGSPWNPGFFAYGSLPMYLLRICASLAGLANPDLASLESSYLVGRALSALFDIGTVFLVYRLGRKLHGPLAGLLAALLVSTTVLHIQLAHFYTVDSILGFWVVLTVLLAVDLVDYPHYRRGIVVGVAWGAALATKVSAAPLALPIALAWFAGALSLKRREGQGTGRRLAYAVGKAMGGSLFTGLVALAMFLICQPYAIIDPITFIRDVVHEGYMARGVVDVPYTRQYIGTWPYLYPLQQMIYWSMGLPLGLAGCLGTVVALWRGIVAVRWAQWRVAGKLWVPLAWVIIYFGVVGSFHAKFLRYMLPILPFLCLAAADALIRLIKAAGQLHRLWMAGSVLLAALIVGGTTLNALAYLNVYREEHPWISATAWLCRVLPPGTPILGEHWDDPLPLLQGRGSLRCYRKHEVSEFEAYNVDDRAKLAQLLEALEHNEYIILSSNRLYNTIPRLPRRYPLTSRYYELLMAERLGFDLVYLAEVYPKVLGVEIVNDTFGDPRLPKPRMVREQEGAHPRINLGRADESFTVYDHPMPLVFRKTRHLSRQELLDLFADVAADLPGP